jgi:hypothetical protein
MANGKKLLEEIVECMRDTGMIKVNNFFPCHTISLETDWKNEDENEILHIVWEEDEEEYSENISENDLNCASIKDGNIIIKDDDGNDFIISLFVKHDLKEMNFI